MTQKPTGLVRILNGKAVRVASIPCMRPGWKAAETCRQNPTETGRISLLPGAKSREEHATEREDLALDAEARSFSLLPADVIETHLRYGAQWDRRLYRAMDQLERLQRRRRGENVPPPLNISLGSTQ
jgi:hypothetical protein